MSYRKGKDGTTMYYITRHHTFYNNQQYRYLVVGSLSSFTIGFCEATLS